MLRLIRRLGPTQDAILDPGHRDPWEKGRSDRSCGELACIAWRFKQYLKQFEHERTHWESQENEQRSEAILSQDPSGLVAFLACSNCLKIA